MLVFLFLLLSKVSVAQTICHDSKVDLVIEKSTGLDDKEFLNDLKSNQVVIVGEHHHKFTKLDARLDLIRTFAKQKGKGACLALEYPMKKSDMEVSLAKMKEIIDRMKSSPEMKKQKGYKRILSALEELYADDLPLTELATSLGLKTRGVDHKDQLKIDISDDDRNKAMSENMKSLIEAKDCSSILFFVGKAHLGLGQSSTTRVQNLTRKNGLSVSTVNLQMTKESVPDFLKSWSVCSVPQKPISKYVVFKNSILKGSPKFYPNGSTDNLMWKDFDYTLLIP